MGGSISRCGGARISERMWHIILGSERTGRWNDGVRGLPFLITGLTLILMKRSLDGSGSQEAKTQVDGSLADKWDCYMIYC